MFVLCIDHISVIGLLTRNIERCITIVEYLTSFGKKIRLVYSATISFKRAKPPVGAASLGSCSATCSILEASSWKGTGLNIIP